MFLGTSNRLSDIFEIIAVVTGYPISHPTPNIIWFSWNQQSTINNQHLFKRFKITIDIKYGQTKPIYDIVLKSIEMVTLNEQRPPLILKCYCRKSDSNQLIIDKRPCLCLKNEIEYLIHIYTAVTAWRLNKAIEPSSHELLIFVMVNVYSVAKHGLCYWFYIEIAESQKQSLNSKHIRWNNAIQFLLGWLRWLNTFHF